MPPCPAGPPARPQGKVVFVAPTRPLVNQQIDACYRFMGVSKAAMAELTGQFCSMGRERAAKGAACGCRDPGALGWLPRLARLSEGRHAGRSGCAGLAPLCSLPCAGRGWLLRAGTEERVWWPGCLTSATPSPAYRQAT